MKQILSFWFILLFLFLGEAQTYTQDSCNTLIRNLQYPSTSVGLLPHSSRLLLFVPLDQLYVYDFPLDSLHDNALHVSESNVKPVLLQQKWPHVYRNLSKFMTHSYDGKLNVNLKPFALYTFWDSTREFVAFRESNYSQIMSAASHKVDSVIFDVSSNVTFNRSDLLYFESSNQLEYTDWPRLVSTSTEADIYYEMFYLPRSEGDHLFDDSLFQFEVTKDKRQINEGYIRLCINSSASEIYFSHSLCKEHLEVFTGGFIHQAEFYLFSVNNVLIFEAKAMRQLNTGFPFVRVAHKDWIRCDKGSSSSVWIIVGTIVTILAVVICALIFIYKYNQGKLSKLPAVLR